MPIDLKNYHPKWSLISRMIRYRRAGNKCERCNVANGSTIKGSQAKVILTVAHLDQDTQNNRFWNLAALCQRCHLNHDRHYNIAKFKYGKDYEKNQFNLFEEHPMKLNITCLDTWSKRIVKGYGPQGQIAAAYYLAAVFRNSIMELQKDFPLLYIIGEPGAGKKGLADGVTTMFGTKPIFVIREPATKKKKLQPGQVIVSREVEEGYALNYSLVLLPMPRLPLTERAEKARAALENMNRHEKLYCTGLIAKHQEYFERNYQDQLVRTYKDLNLAVNHLRLPAGAKWGMVQIAAAVRTIEKVVALPVECSWEQLQPAMAAALQERHYHINR